MDNQQVADPRFQSSTSCFDLQNLYSKSFSSHKICIQPQLLGMLEGEETRNRNLGSVAEYVQRDCSAASWSQTNTTLDRLRPLMDADSPDENIQSRDTLQSLVQSCRCGNRGQDTSIQSPLGNARECKHHKPHHGSINIGENVGVENHYFSKFQLEKQHQVRNVVSERKDAMKQKTRIRWNEDLHNKFIECVDSLGGAKKATPKAILKLMECNGLTIFHVKSHLQKYRDARLIPEATEGTVDQLDSQTGLQIMEALRLQIDVQRRLYEQLESQKLLQKRIEEQAKQLQTMLQCQSNTK